MASTEAVSCITAAGFRGRIVYGSDFPISHWRSVHPEYDPAEAELKQFLYAAFQ